MPAGDVTLPIRFQANRRKNRMAEDHRQLCDAQRKRRFLIFSFTTTRRENLVNKSVLIFFFYKLYCE